MVLLLYILLICYLSIFNHLLPKTGFGAGIPDIDAFRAASYLLLLGSMFHWSIKKDIKFLNRWIITLAVFYTIVFASVIWSNFSYNKVVLKSIFDSMFIPFFIALLSYNLFKTKSNAKIYAAHLSISGFILSIIGIIQMAISLTTGEPFRATAIFTNPNQLAIILVLVLPCLLYAKEKKIVPKIFGSIATVSIIVGVICSVSRKGVFSMILVFCLHSLLKKQYKRFLWLVLAGFLIAVSVSSIEIISGRFERAEVTDAFETKWEMTIAGVKMFMDNPFYGLGYEGYKDHYHQYLPYTGTLRYDAHNIFITALANYGVIGFLPFIYIFFGPLAVAFRVVRNKADNIDEHTYNMAILCMTTIIPFMANGFVAGSLFYSQIEISLFYSNVSLFIAVSENERALQV